MKKASLLIIIALILATSAIVWKKANKKIISTSDIETIIVGTNAEFQPFSFKENDVITGFDIDIITQALTRLGKQMVIKDMPFDALLPEIQLGNIHVIAAGITPTEERAKRALFTRPHLTSDSLVIITPKNKSLVSLDDLKNKTVVVNEGYVSDSFMSEQPGINTLRLSSAAVSDGMLALESGRADAFVTALNPMKPYFAKYDSNEFSITAIPGTEESSALAISKHYPELRSSLQRTLDRMEEDGTLAILKKKWDLL